MSLPGKRIVQQTFDDVVKENIEDLELEPAEAIADAIEQFEAQGIELNNIVTDLVITEGATSWYPVVCAMQSLQTIDIQDTQALYKLVTMLRSECDKSLAHRVLAAQRSTGFETLFNIISKLPLEAIESRRLLLEVFCSFLAGQPDLVTEEAMEAFLDSCRSDDKDICLYGVRLVRLSCIMHETNRQTFVSKGVVPLLAGVLRTHKTDEAIVREVCQTFRTLTLDDDPRVPFGKAHDHAKMIVTEAGALELLLDVALSHKSDAVLADIFATLGRLAVRNEFCQKIVDLGGLTLMLDLLTRNIKHKVIVTNIIGVFKAIAGNDNVKVAITKSDAPAIIVSAIDHHQTSEALCANSCACLATISLRNPENVKRIMECHGHTAVIQCMKLHPNSTQVQKQACMAIRNLVSRTRENNEAILGLGAEELINRAMTVPDCKDEAKAALRDLDCNVELTIRWKGERGQISQ
ncbi:armadillo repeat-containing protein 6-like [Watersipora subatra]|uniref:armadillo repeat-containing protein 6-like n=1 Tax=Watersipora subatra TaxID=2589382 RepID=UPI00355BC8C6